MKFLMFLFAFSGLIAALQLMVARSISGEVNVLEQGDSPYGKVIVSEHDGIRYIKFDYKQLVQSAIYIDNPDKHAHPYTEEIVDIVRNIGFKPKSMAFIGLGGGTIPRILHKDFPESKIIVSEIDPLVLKMAQKYFLFPKDIDVRIADARIMLNEVHGDFDIVIIDAYSHSDIPFHLTTIEFFELVQSKLSARGVVVSNLFRRNKESIFIKASMNTYNSVFSKVHYVLKNNNYVITCSGYQDQKLNLDPVLTDDWAPVNLMRYIEAK